MENRVKKFMEKPKLKKKRNKKQRYDHKKTAFEFLMVIWDTNMELEVKMIMTFRVWGQDPNTYRPMKLEEIAVAIGNAKVQLIDDAERYGKKCCHAHLLKNTLKEIHGRYVAAGGAKNFFRDKGSIII